MENTMVDLPAETRKARILLVDDEPDLLDIMRLALRSLDLELVTATDGNEALKTLRESRFDIVVSDQNMPGTQGLDLLQFAMRLTPNAPIFILITAFGTIDLAVKAMRMGAYDFIKKPFEVEEFVSRVRNALSNLELTKENRVLRKAVEAHYVFSEIVAVSKKLCNVLDLARRASEKNSPVLLLGESGTGKDLLGRAIHFHGIRQDKPFIPINCGAIPKNLIESEFFGHKKGAFTGAVSNRKGCFEEVRGGTIFLDEIGEMPLDLQVKLLRVLEEGKIRRVGENIERSVDFRVLAATNQSLTKMVKEKRFRQDLYYRLNVLAITLPPLRERREDIIPLAENYLKKAKKEMDSHVTMIQPEAMELLQAYDFPGNVRELINIMQRAILLCDGETITTQYLPPEVRGQSPGVLPEPTSLNLKVELDKARTTVEKNLVEKALTSTGGNHKEAAKLLRISRGSLYNILKRTKMG